MGCWRSQSTVFSTSRALLIFSDKSPKSHLQLGQKNTKHGYGEQSVSSPNGLPVILRTRTILRRLKKLNRTVQIFSPCKVPWITRSDWTVQNENRSHLQKIVCQSQRQNSFSLQTIDKVVVFRWLDPLKDLTLIKPWDNLFSFNKLFKKTG